MLKNWTISKNFFGNANMSCLPPVKVKTKLTKGTKESFTRNLILWDPHF